MITATFLVSALACMVVMPVVALVLGLMFRVLGWTLRIVFSVLGVLLLPVWLILMVVGGVAAAAHLLIPAALVLFVGSMLVGEE